MSQNIENIVKQVLYGDCAQELAKFLSPKDIVSICKLYPKHWKKLYPSYKISVERTIDNWFRLHFGDKYEEFKRAMIIDQAVLSGSFILQMMLGEKWEESDIDIFISKKLQPQNGVFDPATYFSTLENFLYNVPNIEDRDDFINFENGIYIDTFGIDALIQIREYNIKREYSENQSIEFNNFKKFQIIELHRDFDIIEFIESTFDFDICKNTFYYTKDGFHLNMKYACDIIDKKAGFKVSKHLVSSLERCKKYMKRGFTFTDALDFSTNYHPNARSEFNKIQTELSVH